MRLDVLLYTNGFARSRTDAKNLVLSGSVAVDAKVITKPSYEVSDSSDIKVSATEDKKFASRAGLKLEGALSSFGVSVQGREALDIGASSGGFTDCLLQHGAQHVIALDSGKDQLVDYLRNDKRVTVIENFNARYLSSEDLEYVPNIVVMDVSFISATYIIPAIFDCICPGGDFICLIKPQFEVGRSGLSKGGIVKDASLRKAAVDKVLSFAENIGFVNRGIIESPITGGDGNIEFLAHFVKEEMAL